MRLSVLILSMVALLSSCSKGILKNQSSNELPEFSGLNSYALVIADDVPNAEALKKQLHRDMTLKNFYYDPASPDFLVMGSFYDQKVELLVGNKYENATHELKMETSKVKTSKNTLLLQLVETEKYATVWRGLSTTNSLSLDPFQMAYRTSSLIHD